MQENNVDIFIGAYKDFTPKVSDPSYKVIYGKHDIHPCGNLQMIQCISEKEPLDDRFFSEIYMLKNLPQENTTKKYIGFCHYRKYFDFLDHIPNLDELFNEYDVILGNPLIFRFCLRRQYGLAHNVEDLDLIGQIIREKYPDYLQSYDNVVQGNRLYPYNMFIMKYDDFQRYINFVSGVLNEYLKIVGTDIEKRIIENKQKYLKPFKPNSTIEYQYRIGGYLAERLSNVFFDKTFPRIKTFPILITDKKYIYEKRNLQSAANEDKPIKDAK